MSYATVDDTNLQPLPSTAHCNILLHCIRNLEEKTTNL